MVFYKQLKPIEVTNILYQFSCEQDSFVDAYSISEDSYSSGYFGF